MTSSQIAQTMLLAFWAVATMILTSAQLRVIKRPPPRRKAYVVAWLICSLLLGALLTMTDREVGVSEPSRVATNLALCAGVSGLALAAGEWWTRSTSRLGPMSALTLFFVHAIVVLVIGHAFI